jgi:hypothetical protein
MTADIRSAGAASHEEEGWHTINWESAYRIVCRLQARMFDDNYFSRPAIIRIPGP